jgi:hypothetical protein
MKLARMGGAVVKELIRNAKVEILEKAFTPLTCAIKTLLQLQNTTNH